MGTTSRSILMALAGMMGFNAKTSGDNVLLSRHKIDDPSIGTINPGAYYLNPAEWHGRNGSRSGKPRRTNRLHVARRAKTKKRMGL